MENKAQRAIYFECYGGISGDMTVAALLDMGADEKELIRQLDTLPLEGFSVEITRVKKSGLDCCDFHVVLAEQYKNHDHDIVYLYGHRKEGAEHVHMHEGHGRGHGQHVHSPHIHEECGHSHSEHVHTHDEHSPMRDEYSHTHDEHSRHAQIGRAHV